MRRDVNDDYEYRLTFYTRRGEFISEFADESVSEFTWLPDGGIAYFKSGQLYIGEVRGLDSIVGAPVVSIAHLDGWPQNLSVSPDGRHFAFEMATRVPLLFETSSYRDATLWQVDNDGRNLRRVATMADGEGTHSETPRVNNPVWSLDGGYLMMAVGVSSSLGIIWEYQYSSATDDYEPVYVSDVIAAKSAGFLYLLPADASDVVFLGQQSYPVILEDAGGEVRPYEVSSLHIEPGAMLVESVPPLAESIAPPASGLGGSLLYLKDWYEDEYRDRLTVMRYDAASGQEQVHWQIAGDDFDDDRYFAVSADGQYYAHWNEISYDDKVLRIYDASGVEMTHYQLLYEDYPDTVGKNLASAPRFSPVNDSLLLYRFIDESDDERLKFGVLDWTSGSYVIAYAGDYASVAFEPDGSVVASLGKDWYRFAYRGGAFGKPVRLFSTPNTAREIDVSADGSMYVFTMAGHLFRCNADGSGLVQLTAPPSTGHEYAPAWSPDGTHVMFMKDGRRYMASAASENLHIGLDVSANAVRAVHVTREGGAVGYWVP